MQVIEAPSVITAAGTPPKLIAEYVGRLNTGGSALSIAHMISPRGWQEPGQTPEFDEYTVVLRGILRVETQTLGREVRAGQAIVAPKGEWVRYSTPGEGGAEYVAICLPAFSPDTVHRDE
jgi:mannose-6-phosphate isomerase-like protein (cupin superfamily)